MNDLLQLSSPIFIYEFLYTEKCAHESTPNVFYETHEHMKVFGYTWLHMKVFYV